MKYSRITYVLSIMLMMLTMCTPTILAQPAQKKPMNPEEFRIMHEKYIIEQTHFTPEEAEKFFKLMNEMKEKQRNLHRQIMQLKKKKFASNTSKKEYASTVQKITSLSVQSAELEDSYYKRILKAVPADKVFKAMSSEDEFFRTVLSRFNHKNPGGRKTPEENRKPGWQHQHERNK